MTYGSVIRAEGAQVAGTEQVSAASGSDDGDPMAT